MIKKINAKNMNKQINKINPSAKFAYKSASAVSLSSFIKKWNFPDPDWSTLPADFPNCDTSTLEKEEKHLFGAIKFAWTVSVGRPIFYKNLIKRSLLTTGVILILALGYAVLSNPGSTLSKAVNAATISAQFRQSQIQVHDILESTASALFKSAR
jgi:hypothetical protein